MLNRVFGTDNRYCDGITRRRMLNVGATRLLGGLSLPALLQLQAQAATGRPAKAKACIFFMLEGGPSHIDMWDLKPDAPTEIRGPFHPISTNVPGTQIGEILPLCSQVADKFTILRSHSHNDNAHQTGRHWLLTGYPPSFADGQAKGVPFNELYPSIGSIVSRELGPGGDVPPYVELPNALGPGGPGFYGAKYAPFTIENDPAQPDFKVRELDVPSSVAADRFLRRQQLLATTDQLGAGQAATGRATVCLIGDVAFLHDISSLTALARRAIDLTIVVTDNDGGAIFSFLPQATSLGIERYEQLFGTPHGTDLAMLCAGHGIAAAVVHEASDISYGPGVRVLIAKTERQHNVGAHDRINAAVSAALDTLGS